jgi:LysR family transcriptional activator of the allD operon
MAVLPMLRYLDDGQLVTCEVINQRQPSPLSLAWHNNGGKAVQEIVSLFQQRDTTIIDFLKNIDIAA